MTPTKQTVYLSVKGFKTPAEEEGYFFTPEQLNEYTANIIKQALETAAEKAKWIAVSDYASDRLSKKDCAVNKESITNTFEETFKKFEV